MKYNRTDITFIMHENNKGTMYTLDNEGKLWRLMHNEGSTYWGTSAGVLYELVCNDGENFRMFAFEPNLTCPRLDCNDRHKCGGVISGSLYEP